MMKQLFLSFSALLVFLLHFTTTLAQAPAKSPAQAQAPAQAPAVVLSPPAPLSPALSPPVVLSPALSPVQVPPAPSGKTNITTILGKAGKFSTLIWLLGNTQVGDRINLQLNKGNKALTLFAPTDDAFSSLKSGLLNSLSDQQRVQLMLFHVLSSFISLSQFKAVSNPLHTQAGDNDKGNFPLNVTTTDSQVNISTGIVTAAIVKTIYIDSQLGVYEVDRVLLPLAIFNHKSSVLAPSSPDTATPSTVPLVEASSATGLIRHAALSFGVAAIAAFSL
ncbi:hypothetical protein HHK36_018229 [Tetracentron sinense]|uniref:FAS1 domain-containing protein n=1 Tax=Tetracentron sinense TaxID=13715 RepID=A0A835DDT1_TETSI|nr:hypothetical protein HHK36_018213 [Tetracentron sinense]KAF8396605.1 hypothetical protein HHK36_018229 [Tetracentron sinense]